MENLENEIISIHQETIHKEANSEQALEQSGLAATPLIDRTANSIGDLLIRLGTRLKKQASAKLTTEEASSPSYLIML